MEAILFLVLYFLPSIIAYYRGHASKNSILMWNVLTGWTGVMWLVCLSKAIGNKGGVVVVNVNNNVGSVTNGSNHKGN